MQYDYLIVGQGIAGTILGYTLWNKGKKIFFIDQDFKDSSSLVAAGIYNPITGKRLVKSWKADQLFGFLYPFYEEFEKTFNVSILHDIAIYKPFNNIEEQNYWFSRSTDKEISNYINLSVNDPPITELINNNYGGMEIRYSGYVDVYKLITTFREYLNKKELIKTDYLDINALKFNSDSINYKDINAKKIIFCEGYKAAWNPWFSNIPYVSVKGELCTLKIDVPTPSHIINKNVFLIPLGNGKFKAGSTYDWEFLDTIPSKKGKQLLERELQFMLKPGYKIIDQQAGVRPVVKDRRPIIGLHPNNRLIGIFNGLGSKGVSICPFFAQHFSEYLENDKQLDKEVDVKRFH